MSNLKKYKIPLPSTKTEQTAIATVLSDVDALISGLDNTLAKKRLIKQGAMQELLTGKLMRLYIASLLNELTVIAKYSILVPVQVICAKESGIILKQKAFIQKITSSHMRS